MHAPLVIRLMSRIPNPKIYTGLGLFFLVSCVAVFGASMLGANDGDRAAAMGGVLGGMMGAMGAAVAVYLTLQLQRDDETEKISTAIITEIAQLARFPCEQLTLCRAIYAGAQPGIPRQHIRIFMQTPTPTLYAAAAGSISRVPRPTLVITFYLGLVETEKCVNVIASTPSPNLFLTPIDVEGLGILLAEQCRLAKRILEEYSVPEGREKELVTRMLTILIAMLSDEIAASEAHFPTTQQYQDAQ
jgi:hypothetical protein